MKKLNYSQEISASPERVYDVMLGLSDKRTYEQWCAVFNPTSTWEGGWNKDDKILFTARIAENDPGKYVSIEHYGIVEKDAEITAGEKVEGWNGAHENYRFEAIEGGTRLAVDVDMVDEYISYMDEQWPKALKELKRICEAR